MIITVDYEFASAHFYTQKKWSEEQNRATFGKCHTPNGHGHNYRLELEIDIGSFDITKAKSLIDSSIQPLLNQLDHEHLNFTVPHFKDTVPTTENISLYIKDQIRIPAPFHVKLLRLSEMDSIFVELKL